MKRILAPLLVAAAFLFSGCPGLLAGSTSTGNTGKGTIAGRVIDADGQGVAGARVTVVETDHNPGPGGSGGADAIAVTEADGSFRTDSLPDGFYNLLGAKDGKVTFIDSVGVRGDSGSRSGDARLRPPGTVTGVVRLRPGHDSRTVFLILIGTTTFAVPKDSTGNFSLAGLAEGEYRLRALSTLDAYAPLDTVIRAEAGKTIALPDTLRLPYLSAGLPVLDYPELAFDTTNLEVRVSWRSQDPSKVAGYNIYRRPADSGFARLTPAPIKDTFFIDGWDLGYRPDRVYEYAVTALDSRGNEALKGFSSVFGPRSPVRVDTMLELSHCLHAPCPMDADSAGTVWVVSADTSVLKITASGKASSWRYSAGDMDWAMGLRVDDSGQVYMLMGPSRSRVVKYDGLGRLQWEVPLPDARLCTEDCLQMKRDTILVWNEGEQIQSRISKDGKLLREDRIPFRTMYMKQVQATLSNQEIGFIGGDSFKELIALDPIGNVVYRWNPVRHDFPILSQFTMDSDGRWFLIWGDGRMEIYSTDRGLLRTIPAPRGLRRIEYRRGALYVEADWALLRFPFGF